MPYRLIGNDRKRGLDWAVPRLEGGIGHWDNASCLILEKDGDITAVAVYNHYYPKNSVEISIAAVGGRWLTRPFLATVFRIPFLDWELRRVGSSIAADNHKSIRFCEHLGFVREGCIRQAAPSGQDLLLYGLLKSECRYLGSEFHGETVSTSRARSGSDGCGSDHIEQGNRDSQCGVEPRQPDLALRQFYLLH